MTDSNSTSLCRICLQDGATFPIFENSESDDNIYKKLVLCLQCENIKDVDGFPRHICSPCNITLSTLCNFINKFKESTKILENGVSIVKNEYNDVNDVVDLSEVEVEIKDIKVESDGDFDDEEPLNILKKLKKQVIKEEPKSRKNKSRSSTNKIASSLLEGDFLWTGEKWCMKIQQTTIRRIKPKARPQTKVKVPNVVKDPELKLCDLCGDVFNDQQKLKHHKSKVHFKKPVKCPKCPLICASDYYLNRHIRRKHDLKRDFICSCGKSFAYKGELTTHIRNVHDKHLKPPKKYSCKICQKSYKCQKSVIVHERSVHTGQRPAQCTICDSRFYHEDYLKEHMRLHTGETPFKCPICGRGYAQRGNMKSHLRIHKLSELDSLTLSKMKPNYLKLLKS